MKPEVVVLVERKTKYDSTPVAYHIGTDAPLKTGCGAGNGDTLGTGYYGRPEADKLCPACLKVHMLPADNLAGLAEAIDALVGELRADAGSLHTHGSISRAIGQLHKAAEELVAEAKDRALKEVRRRK